MRAQPLARRLRRIRWSVKHACEQQKHERHAEPPAEDHIVRFIVPRAGAFRLTTHVARSPPRGCRRRYGCNIDPSAPPSNSRPSPDSGWRSGAFHFFACRRSVRIAASSSCRPFPCRAAHGITGMPEAPARARQHQCPFRGFIHEIQAQNDVFLYLQYLQSEDEAALQTAPRPPHEHHRARLTETRNSRAARSSLVRPQRRKYPAGRSASVRRRAAALGARDCFPPSCRCVLTAAGQGVEHGRFAVVRVARQRHGAPHGCTSDLRSITFYAGQPPRRVSVRDRVAQAHATRRLRACPALTLNPARRRIAPLRCSTATRACCPSRSADSDICRICHQSAPIHNFCLQTMRFCEIWCYSALPAHIVRQTPKEARLHMKTSESYLPEGSYMGTACGSAGHFQRSAHCGRRRTRTHSGSCRTAVHRRARPAVRPRHRTGASCRACPVRSASNKATRADCHSIACGGKPASSSADIDEARTATAWLSRFHRPAEAQDRMLDSLRPGDVIPARVTHLEPFGAFVDVRLRRACRRSSASKICPCRASATRRPIDRRAVHLAAVRTVEPENREFRSPTASCSAPGRRTRRCSPSVRPRARGVVRSIESRTACSSSLRPTCPALPEPRADRHPGC